MDRLETPKTDANVDEVLEAEDNASAPDDNQPGDEVGSPEPEAAVDEAAPLADDQSDIEQLRAALAAADARAAENLDGWQRAQADFQNYKRRVERDLQQTWHNATDDIFTRFFPVLDDLELALDSLPESGDGAQWSEGVNLVRRKFLNLLEVEGVTVIEAEPGHQFDPNVHEAITQEDSEEYDTDTIIGVLRKGYQRGERVLRPAQVRVAK